MKILDREIDNKKIVDHIQKMLIRSLKYNADKYTCPVCFGEVERNIALLNQHVSVCRQRQTDSAIETINVWRKRLRYNELSFLDYFSFNGLKINSIDLTSMKAMRKMFVFFSLIPSPGILYNIFIILNAYNSCIYSQVDLKEHFSPERLHVIEHSSSFHQMICSNFATRRGNSKFPDEDEICFDLFYSEIFELYHVNLICRK